MPTTTKRLTLGTRPTGDGVPSGETTLTGSPITSPSCWASSLAENDAGQRGRVDVAILVGVLAALHRHLDRRPESGERAAGEVGLQVDHGLFRSGGTPRTTTPDTLWPLLSMTWL